MSAEEQVGRDVLGRVGLSTGFTLLVIGTGIAARLGEVMETSASAGVARFAGSVALPAAVFRGIAAIDFGTVDGKIVLVLTLSRVVVFGLGALYGYNLHGHKAQRLARAGIFGIFCTQSNDFAFGLPIVESVFPPAQSRTNFTSYILLLAPIQLGLINVFGFLLAEMSAEHASSQPLPVAAAARPSIARAFARAAMRVLATPVVTAVLLALAWQAVVGVAVPLVFDRALAMLADSFAGSALFLVGFTAADSLAATMSPGLFVRSLTLSCLKTVVLAFVAVLFAKAIVGTHDVMLFSVIAGALPVAPTLYTFSQQYGVDTHLIACGVLVCLLVSAPLLLATAVLVPNNLPKA